MEWKALGGMVLYKKGKPFPFEEMNNVVLGRYPRRDEQSVNNVCPGTYMVPKPLELTLYHLRQHLKGGNSRNCEV